MKADEAFYTAFWKQSGWTDAAPNADEKIRWEMICSLLEKFRNVKDDLSTLDLGCGRGWLTRLLSQYGPTVGVDPVAGAITHARRLFPSGRFVVGSAVEAVAANDGRPFDLIVCSEVLEHVPNIEKPAFLRELNMALRRDGHAILTTPRGEWVEHARARGMLVQPVEDWVTSKQLQRLMVSSGFNVDSNEYRYVPGYDFSLRLKLLRRRPMRALARIPLCARWISRLRNAHGIYQAILAHRIES